MTAIVVEQALASAGAAEPSEAVVVVSRARVRRRGWADLDPDDVVAALDGAGPRALVLARPVLADPGARALPALAAVMGREVVRLPGDDDAAAWVVAVAGALAGEGADAARRLQVLVGATAAPALPRRPVGAGTTRMPALRPGVLARWAGCAWRPCGRCAGDEDPSPAVGLRRRAQGQEHREQPRRAGESHPERSTAPAPDHRAARAARPAPQRPQGAPGRPPPAHRPHGRHAQPAPAP